MLLACNALASLQHLRVCGGDRHRGGGVGLDSAISKILIQCIVNAYFQFSQQVRTNLSVNILVLKNVEPVF